MTTKKKKVHISKREKVSPYSEFLISLACFLLGSIFVIFATSSLMTNLPMIALLLLFLASGLLVYGAGIGLCILAYVMIVTINKLLPKNKEKHTIQTFAEYKSTMNSEGKLEEYHTEASRESVNQDPHHKKKSISD